MEFARHHIWHVRFDFGLLVFDRVDKLVHESLRQNERESQVKQFLFLKPQIAFEFCIVPRKTWLAFVQLNVLSTLSLWLCDYV